MCTVSSEPYRIPSIFVGAVLFVVTTILLSRILAATWTTFELSEASKKHGDTLSSFYWQASHNFLSVILMSYIGLAGLLSVFKLGSTSLLGGHSPVFADTETSCLIDHLEVVHCGQLFTMFILTANFNVILGWEKGLDIVFHHLFFLITSSLIQLSWIGTEATAGMLMMELSTPILVIMTTFRRLVGWENFVAKAKLAFAASFVACRVCLFGYIIFTRCWLPWYTDPEVWPRAAREQGYPAAIVATLHVLVGGAWGLQAYWFVCMASGLLKKKKKKA